MLHQYSVFSRKVVQVNGLPTSQLLRERKIRTPYPHIFTDQNFPFWGQHDSDVLFVLVPLERDESIGKVFEQLNLIRPTPAQAIRFVSQSDDRDKHAVHRGKTIIFPCDPPFVDLSLVIGHERRPADPQWLALAWRGDRSEAILVHTERDLSLVRRLSKKEAEENGEFAVQWPKNSLFAGVSTLC